jgi:hypothetical protein
LIEWLKWILLWKILRFLGILTFLYIWLFKIFMFFLEFLTVGEIIIFSLDFRNKIILLTFVVKILLIGSCHETHRLNFLILKSIITSKKWIRLSLRIRLKYLTLAPLYLVLYFILFVFDLIMIEELSAKLLVILIHL